MGAGCLVQGDGALVFMDAEFIRDDDVPGCSAGTEPRRPRR